MTGAAPLSPPAVIGRFSALTIPSVTEFCSASGEPMAITVSPTCRSEDLPTCSTVGLVTLTFTTARSVFWSEPTTFASVRVPSTNTAVIFTPGSAVAEVMTCSLVSR